MVNQLKNISNSPVCEISVLIILCCMLAGNLSLKAHGQWTDLAMGANIVGGIVLFGLLIWATCKLAMRREVKEMPVRPRICLDMISRLLLLYWLYITGGPVVAAVWGLFVVWSCVAGIRQFISAR